MSRIFGVTVNRDPVSLFLGYSDVNVDPCSSRLVNILAYSMLHKETFSCSGSGTDPPPQQAVPDGVLDLHLTVQEGTAPGGVDSIAELCLFICSFVLFMCCLLKKKKCKVHLSTLASLPASSIMPKVLISHD